MKKILTGIAVLVLLVTVYMLFKQLSWVQITTFFTLFFITGLAIGLITGLFTADKGLLLQEKRLKEALNKAEQRADQAEHVARQRAEEELEMVYKELEIKQANLNRQQQRLVDQKQELDRIEAQIKKEAKDQIMLAKRYYDQAEDKKTKAMAYNERKARRLEKLRAKIESKQEVTTQDVLNAIK